VSDPILRGRTHEGDLVLDADVVVVGSGSAGAVVAAVLAEAGQEVVILEEGPHIAPEAHARMRPSEAIRHTWREGAMTVAVGLGDTPAVQVAMGRCVGGSSITTGGVCFRTPEEVLDGWAREHGLTDLAAASMEPFFEDAERAVHVEEVPVAMRSRGIRLFGEGLEKKGFSLRPIRRNTDGCRGCGCCNFGCPHQAKRSVVHTYLPRAFDKGARLVSDCLVERILVEGDRAVGVQGRLLDGPRAGRAGRITVRARRVAIAAGAWHSPLLLKASGVGRASKQVGRNLTLHPSCRMLGRFDDPVRGWAGALQSAWSDAFEDENITIVGLFVPPAILAATMPGVGPRLAARAAGIPHLAMMGGLIHDQGGGVIRRGPGREPLVTYRMSKRDRAAFPKLIRSMAEVFLEAGAREVFLPILGHEPVDADGLARLDLERIPARRLECASQHPLGSCRMGVSAASSVVGPDGQAWGLRDLYVVDGSVLPSSLGVNPQLTILAMATRIAHGMRERPLRE